MIFRNVFGAFRIRVDKSAIVLPDKFSNRHSKLLLGNSVQKTIFRLKTIAGSAPGSGAGKGGGPGGTMKQSGGGLGEYGSAQEEHYFFMKQRQQLEELKKKLKKEDPAISKKEDK